MGPKELIIKIVVKPVGFPMKSGEFGNVDVVQLGARRWCQLVLERTPAGSSPKQVEKGVTAHSERFLP